MAVCWGGDWEERVSPGCREAGEKVVKRGDFSLACVPARSV